MVLMFLAAFLINVFLGRLFRLVKNQLYESSWQNYIFVPPLMLGSAVDY